MKKKKTTDSELLEQIRALQSRINLLEKTKKNRQEVQESLRESIELYQALLEISPDAIIISDLNRRIIMVNEEAARAHGFDSMEEMIGLNILTLIAPEDRKHTQGPLKEKNFRYKKFSLLKKDGSVFPAEISLSVLKDAQGNPQAFIGMMRNLAEYNKIVDELKQKSVFENLIVSLSAKLINLDEKEVDQGINNALKAIGDFAKVDRSYIFLFSADGKKMDNTHEWCAPGIEPQIKRLQKISVDAFPWFIKNIKKQQTLYVPRVSDLPDAAGDEKKEWEAEKIKSLINVPMVFKGELIGFIGFDSVMETKEWPEEMRMLLRIMADLLAGVVKRRYMEWDIRILHKELLKTNMRLKQMALRDSLTGLFNHRYFEDAIESEFTRAKRQVSPLSIIMFDVDYFKSINDVYGHEFGDIVLKQLAKQLMNMVRKYDTVIRYGGEEFIIITPGADKKIAMILAGRLMDVIKLYNFGNKQHQVKLKLSVAVASFPEDKIQRGSDFIKIADYILNKVKELGGDRVYSYGDVTAKGKTPVPIADDTADVTVLKEKLEKLTKRANQSLAEAIFAFAKTIDIKDHYTGEHVEKTVHYATEIARAKGLSKDEVENIKQAAILHDLGKIGISENILLKDSKLTPEEYEEIKKHPQIGADILRPIHLFHALIPLVLHHHERWDGKGYPYGLRGEDIPLGARIIALADTYEALTSDRRYRKACANNIAVQKIQQVSGTQFDPEIVELFLKVIQEEQDNGY